MKKFFALLLSAVMLFSAFTAVFAATTPYDGYEKISGKIERLQNTEIKKGDKFDVSVAVNFNDSVSIEKITAFHLLGSCSDNLKITEFDFYDASKKPANTVSGKMKDQTIDYTSAAMPEEAVVTADSDGFGRLLKITFEALESGEAEIHLDGCYIRTSFEDDEVYKRCLAAADFTVTVSASEDAGEDSSDNSGDSDNSEDVSGNNGSSSSSGSSGNAGSNSGTTAILPGLSGSSGASGSNGGSSAYIPTPPDDENKIIENTFADVEKSHWGYEYANELFNKKIISGSGMDENGNAVLNPDAEITREEAVKIAVAAAEIALSEQFELSFSDKSEIAEWAQKYVFAGVENGILSGYSEDNTFRPKNKITREELVKIIIGAFGIKISENADVSAFADAELISWSAPYIAAAVENGIIKGYDDGTVRPNATVTRIEAVTMFGRAVAK